MLASAIREMIAPVLRDAPHECGIVSITEVKVSEDFSYATVFISALLHPDIALAFLDKQKLRLQRHLSALQRKKIPFIRFRIDERGDRGMRIEQLLSQS